MASPPQLSMSSELDTSASSSLNNFHKTQHRWNLWSHLPHDVDWTLASYNKLYLFSTIEETVYVLKMLPESLVKNCMLFIMKDGVAPSWEDPQNRHGGCFSYKILNKYVCDIWNELSYVLVGESMSGNADFVNSITGITISPKKSFCIIKIWTSGCEFQNPDIITASIKGLTTQGCLFKKHAPEF
jgi:translation initiation factor 4E